ncbi:MAG: MBL fold metallo-hydrolase [Alistipes senegalensis]|nr:MBL fold metallo-hydrolase [Oxalobacter formigenes]MCM1281676.1 MBL fold metallo-hydrolase [Alistipes senegalensis]
MSENTLRITILVDNEAKEGLAKEHGFAAWIEAGQKRILFDTGHEGALQVNAAKLGIDLSTADTLVISHGHKDHTGTLDRFLAINDHAELYFAGQIDAERYWYKPDPDRYGMPDTCRKAFEALPASRLHSLSGPHYLAPGIGITGPVSRLSSFEDTGGTFYFDKERGKVDPIEDDQSMWFETEKGLVILLGCCHSGLSNTIDYIRKASGIEKVCGVMGGMHLLQASEERLEKTFNIMRSWQAEFLIPCHCTGLPSAEKMANALGNTVSHGCAGLVVEAGRLT